MKILVRLLIIIILLSTVGCTKENKKVLNISPNLPKDEQIAIKELPITEQKEDVTIENELSEAEIIELQLINTIENMTLEEKVGQMFILAFRNDDSGKPIKDVNDNIITTISEYNIGGVIFFSENIESPMQTWDFIYNLQKSSNIPLFIGIDEEGGRVSRIGNNPNMKATRIPNMMDVGLTGKWEDAYHIGMILGKELKALGFNLDFAPVADVYTNPNNSVIGNRAYGNEASLVANMVSAEVIGMQEQGISACIKHFPGHGDTYYDTHKGKVQVMHDYDRLNDVEWLPFKEGIRVGTDFVMVGHISTPNLTKVELPATLSKELIKEYLRYDLGFGGVVITDAMEMGAITNYYSTKEATLLAVQAGVDIILMPDNFEVAYNAIMDAVESGIISEARINESVKRVLTVKKKRDLNFTVPKAEIENILGNEEHIKIIQNIESKILNK